MRLEDGMADELESVIPVGRDLADAVLEAFTRHRLVGIGESHGLQNHHDALQLLLTDPRLPEVVDDIVVELPHVSGRVAGTAASASHVPTATRS